MKYKFQNIGTVFRSGAENFHNTPISYIEDKMMTLIENEGPLHEKIVKRRIADLYQVRIGNRVNKTLDYVLFLLDYKKKVKRMGGFIYSIHQDRNILRVYDGITKRKIDEISPQEIMMAVIECVKNSYSIGEIDLIKETARLFGLQARNSTSNLIYKAIKILLSNGCLNVKNGKIVLGNKLK